MSKIQEELRDYKTAQNITSALRDISAIELQKIKEEFEKGRLYYQEVVELYRLVKFYATRQKFDIEKRKGEKRKTVSVAATSNKRFYGTLNNDVMSAFVKHMDEEKESDFYVIGRTGKQYVSGTPYEKRCTFFEFKEDDPTAAETVVFIDTTRRYDQVFVFYPKFLNVFKQDITVADITYIFESKRGFKHKIDYIFEPELDEIFWFFDTQVRYILFNQVILEIKLARTAARLVRMNKGEQNAREAIKATRFQIHKVLGALQNIRLLETFSGISKWKKR